MLANNDANMTCLRESSKPITTLNVPTYVTPLVVRNFWLYQHVKIMLGPIPQKYSNQTKCQQTNFILE